MLLPKYCSKCGQELEYSFLEQRFIWSTCKCGSTMQVDTRPELATNTTINPSEINEEWLLKIGFSTDNEKAANQYVTRIVGADDDGSKESTDDDNVNDEIANLILHKENNIWYASIEVYELRSLNSVNIIELGIRKTKMEVYDLCKALKAWGICDEC